MHDPHPGLEPFDDSDSELKLASAVICIPISVFAVHTVVTFGGKYADMEARKDFGQCTAAHKAAQYCLDRQDMVHGLTLFIIGFILILFVLTIWFLTRSIGYGIKYGAVMAYPCYGNPIGYGKYAIAKSKMSDLRYAFWGFLAATAFFIGLAALISSAPNQYT